MQEISSIPGNPEIGTFEAARLIGVSVPTVRELCERGELAGWRVGRNYKFTRQAVNDFLNRSARPLAA
ncbi:MAG: helix-turn-helix domain-containing protein [Acidobacteriota bacterium]|nr:helix-turn-helix domain-containing protein [Acidobacteriota bacterium]